MRCRDGAGCAVRPLVGGLVIAARREAMSETPRRSSYARKLAHAITLADARSLTRLKHAADLITRVD
jgi:hypothetical protein